MSTNAIDLLADTLHHTEDMDPSELKTTLRNYPSELLNKMVPVSTSDPIWCAAAKLMADNAPAATINEALCYYPHMARNNKNFAQSHLGSLHHYPALPSMEDYSTADEKTRQQCIALLVAVEQLDEAAYNIAFEKFASDDYDTDTTDFHPIESTSDRNRIIKSPELVKLIIEYPARVQQIIDFIVERKTVDVDGLKVALENPSPVLARGSI
jgi:hypothetical protein